MKVALAVLATCLTVHADVVEKALGIFNRDFDDVVIENGETENERYIIKHLKKCDLTMPDGKVLDL